MIGKNLFVFLDYMHSKAIDEVYYWSFLREIWKIYGNHMVCH